MASHDGASLSSASTGRASSGPRDRSSSSPESSSESTHSRRPPGSRLPPAGCQWRTSRFHLGECSRFFDCPSHVVERALSDDGDSSAEEQHRMEPARAGAGAGADVLDRPPMTVSPLSEDGLVEGGSEIPRPPPLSDSRDLNNHGARASTYNSFDPPEGIPAVLAGPGLRLSTDARPSLAPRPPRSFEEMQVQARPAGITAPPTYPATLAGQSSLAPAHARLALVLGSSAPPVPTELWSQPGAADITQLPPRWQPDAEATYCPICRTQFSIFVRKHHCRKCGRVVCNSCSPHRITIPHQYIAQPPQPPGLSSAHAIARSVLLLPSGIEPEPERSGIMGGGARVRLCNPCVPDPNTAPPSAQASGLYRSHIRSQSTLSDRPYTGRVNSSFNWTVSSGAAPRPGDSLGRSRSVTMGPGNSSSQLRSNSSPTGPVNYLGAAAPYSASQAIYQPIAAQMAAQLAAFHLDLTSRTHPQPGHSGTQDLPDPQIDPRNYRGGMATARPPRAQVAEEDECPICHHELPWRTVPNFEALREQHIDACIQSYGSSVGGSTRQGTSLGSETARPGLRRRTRMIPYIATEKDCVDMAECTICLEEFVAGVEMARLECLCRFHKACIDAWWKRHPGRCPMHQHDGFGM